MRLLWRKSEICGEKVKNAGEKKFIHSASGLDIRGCRPLDGVAVGLIAIVPQECMQMSILAVVLTAKCFAIVNTARL